MKSVRLLVFVCLVLVLASCSFKQTWDIFGKWQSVESSEIVQFSQDSVMTLENENTAVRATFKMIDSKHLQIYFGSLATLDMKVSISNDELTLEHADGAVSKFKRVK